MKKILVKLITFAVILFPQTVFAASNQEVSNFTNDTLTTLIILASTAVVFFLIRGAYIYITSSGNPVALEDAKRTIKNALIGLVVVIAAAAIASLLNNAMMDPSSGSTATTIELAPIQPTEETGSLTQILLDAVSGFLQNIVQSAATPILDGITWFLTSTPSLASNSVIFNFWLVMVGITDSLFAIAIALMGFQIMSASTFGFEELTLKELLPRIALAFLLANTSIFWIDWIISLCQTLVNATLSATGGLGNAWIINAFDPAALVSGSTAIITLIFAILFILMAIVLLIFYISRLMILAFGAVISPLVCLLSLSPRFSDLANNATKVYFVTIFTVFIHVVIIQLSSAFLTVPGQSGANPIISLLIGIALFSVILKSTSMTVQMAMSAQTGNALKKVGSQLFNAISSSTAKSSRAAKVTKTVRPK